MNKKIEYIYNWYFNRNKPSQKPIILNYPIIDICNSKCQMCSIWENKDDPQIPADEIGEILSNPFFSELEYIGISGGEPTLRSDLIEVLDRMVRKTKKLRSITITSHGYQYEKWKKLLPQIIDITNRENISFTLNISLDGIGEVHDKIRGVPGAFKKTERTIFLAKENKVKTQLQCTVSHDNIYNIGRVLNFAESLHIEVVFRVATKVARLNNQNKIQDIFLSKNEKSFFADFISSDAVMNQTKSPIRRLFYRDLSNRLEGKYFERKAPCYFQKEGVLLTQKSDLYQCSIVEEKIGRLKNIKNISEIYFSKENILSQAELKKNLCATCMHDQVGPWPPYLILKEIFQQGTVGIRFKAAQKLIVFSLKASKSLITQISKPPLQSQIDSNSIKKIVVIGAYGGEHVGDAAILGGVIFRAFNKYPQLTNVDVVSIRPDRTSRWLSELSLPVKVDVITTKESSDKISKADLLMYAGGPIMELPNLILTHSALADSMIKLNKPFEIEGVGFGPFRHNVTKYFGYELFKKSTNSSVRSKKAQKELNKKGIRTTLCLDPAFDYLETRSDLSKVSKKELDSLDCLLKNSNETLIGINLRPLWNRYSKNLSKNEVTTIENSFLDELSNALSDMSSEKETTFIFFPMNPDQFGFSDLSIAYKLSKKLDNAVDFRIWEYEPGIDALLHLIRKLDIAITMRFHASIFCLSQKTHTIGIDYMLQGRGKVYDLFCDLGIQDKVVNIEDFKSAWLMKQSKKNGSM